MLMHAPPPGRGERKPCCTQAALRTRVLLLWQEEKPCCTQAVLTHVPHWGIPDERQALLEVGRAMAREPGDSGDQVLLHAGRAYARTLAADARRQALSYAGRAHARTSLGAYPTRDKPCCTQAALRHANPAFSGDQVLLESTARRLRASSSRKSDLDFILFLFPYVLYNNVL